MGIKLCEYKNINPMFESVLMFHCPGCGDDHPFDLNRWEWNGSMDKPTFSPSLMVNLHMPNQCHFWVTNGMILFQGDCHHQLKGKTVELPDWEEVDSPN